MVFTQGAVLGTLYILIVFQKESLFDTIPDKPIDTLDRGEWGNFTTQQLEPHKDLKYLLRRMRNALAHANVDASDGFVFRFRDKRPNDTDFTFDVSFDSGQLQKFVCKLTEVLFKAQVTR